MRQSWLDECMEDVRKNTDPRHQNAILNALECQIDTPPKYHYYLYGPQKGRVKAVTCGNCGAELGEPYWKHCPNCGRPLPEGWCKG